MTVVRTDVLRKAIANGYIIPMAKATSSFFGISEREASENIVRDGSTTKWALCSGCHKEIMEYANKSANAGCFVATAACGNHDAWEVRTLSVFRDDFLQKSEIGRRCMEFYYLHSRPLADFIAPSRMLRVATRNFVVQPLALLAQFLLLLRGHSQRPENKDS
jgi:hypothetical protein